MGINASEERILEQLRLGREAMPDWAEALDLQIALLEAQMEVEIPAVEVKLSAEEATQRRRQGIPLVSGRELRLDWDAFVTLYRRVCQISAAHRADLADDFAALSQIADDEPEQLQSWVFRFMAEGRSSQDDELGLKSFTLTHTLRPFLRRYAQAYASLVDESGWRRGYCPICGGEPDFGSLSAKDEGARHLLCSRCDNEWLYKRLGCPLCESTDHGKIRYYPEEKGPHRLYVCDECKRYLKTIDLRGAPGRVLLPVERVLTMGMDVAARDAGYG